MNQPPHSEYRIGYVAPDLARVWGLFRAGLPIVGIVADGMGVDPARTDVPFVEIPIAEGESTRSIDRLDDPRVIDALQAHRVTHVLFFKSSHAGLQAARQRGWAVLAGDPAIAQHFENKVHFTKWAQRAGLELPPVVQLQRPWPSFTELAPRLGALPWVVQTSRSHSGQGTWRVATASEYEDHRDKLGHRTARVMQFVSGPTLTVNGVAWATKQVDVGNPYVQITGWEDCTPYALGACGNLWPAPPDAPIADMRDLAQQVGRGLAEAGYVGAFGVDAIARPSGLALIEVNPRVVSGLALEALTTPGRSIAEAHVRATMGEEFSQAIVPATAAPMAQLVFYSTAETPSSAPRPSSGTFHWNGEDLQRVSDKLDPRDCGPGEAVIWWRSNEIRVPGTECARAQWPIHQWPIHQRPHQQSPTFDAPDGFAKTLAAAVRQRLALNQ